jgi:hypothetical protein
MTCRQIKESEVVTRAWGACITVTGISGMDNGTVIEKRISI